MIGRNNSGKSRLLDFAQILCGKNLNPTHLNGEFSSVFTKEALQRNFDHRTSGGQLGGNHWESHGRLWVDNTVKWIVKQGNVSFEIDNYVPLPAVYDYAEKERERQIKTILSSVQPTFAKKEFRRILADRDIQPEPNSTSMELDIAGYGATNIIRRYLRSTNDKYSRDLIQTTLRAALNEIFSSDGNFTEIKIGDHDETANESIQDHFEVYLGERNKGLVALSKSGSGLKTIFLVLLNLIVVPNIEQKKTSDYVFAFEELENNLHPSLLRRLLAFIAKFITEQNSILFLTTHSSTALDMFGANPEAQIVHVEHDGESAKSTTVSDHFSRTGVVAALGAKPSDLLQANGILWLEGPSDRIYLNRWIEIFSEGRWREGQHYQCAFYGGSVLARTEFVAPDDGVDALVNLANINSNIVVVCDSDRTKKSDELKPRVARIQKEVGELPNACVWVTEAKEIENYILGSHLKAFCNLDAEVPNPTIYQRFFPSKKLVSFMSKELGRKTMDKVELAIAVAPMMTLKNMSSRFDLKESVEAVIEKIEAWNI